MNCRNCRRRICWGKRLSGRKNAIYREFFSRAVCTKCNQVFHHHWNQTGLCSPWRAAHSHCRSPRGPLKACSTQFWALLLPGCRSSMPAAFLGIFVSSVLEQARSGLNKKRPALRAELLRIPSYTKKADASASAFGWKMGFEPTTSGATNQRSNQLSYNHHVVFPLGFPPKRTAKIDKISFSATFLCKKLLLQCQFFQTTLLPRGKCYCFRGLSSVGKPTSTANY